MRVTFLTHYYPPEVGAPQVRIAAVARALCSHGLEVTVHTCAPHYPDGIVPDSYENRLFQRASIDGVEVIRSLVYPAPNRGFARRLADHFSFALSALITSPLTPPADVLVVETPPLFTAGAAIAYAAAKRGALVVNVADRWPASAVELGAIRNRAAIRAAHWLESRVYRSAALVTVPTEGLQATLESLPAAHGKVVRIAPSVDLDLFDPSPTRARGGPLRAVYAGTVGLAHGLSTLAQAARLAGPEVVQVTVAGGGAEAAELREVLPANVTFVGVVPHEHVPNLYAEGDVGVVLLRDREIFTGALPTKLLEILASRRAAVVSARGESARLVSDAGVGLTVPPEDPQALAEAFRELHRDPDATARFADAGRELVERRYARGRAVDQWLDVIMRAARG